MNDFFKGMNILLIIKPSDILVLSLATLVFDPVDVLLLPKSFSFDLS